MHVWTYSRSVTSAVLFSSGCMFGITQDQLPQQSYSTVDACLELLKISYLSSLIQQWMHVWTYSRSVTSAVLFSSGCMFGITQDQLPQQSYSVVDACLDILKISYLSSLIQQWMHVWNYSRSVISAVLFNSGCMFGHTQDQLSQQSYSVVDACLDILKISYLSSLIQ